MLFGQTDLIMTKDGGFACSLALAIAEYQADLADVVLDSWQNSSGHYGLFTDAADGNDAYYDPADATTDSAFSDSRPQASVATPDL